MTEADWLTSTDFPALVRFAADRLSPRRQRLLGVGFCRAVAHLIAPPAVLLDALALYDDCAEHAVWPSEAEKARQRCRIAAQEAYEEYRAAVEGGPGRAGGQHVRCEFAWAVSFIGVCPLPLAEVGTRAAIAAEYAVNWRENGRSVSAGGLLLHGGVKDDQAEVMRGVVRDVVGNPFRPAAIAPDWRTDTVMLLARHMYDTREFGAMPILADALQDAGCTSDEILTHCRGPAPHFRGCWVVDALLGKT